MPPVTKTHFDHNSFIPGRRAAAAEQQQQLPVNNFHFDPKLLLHFAILPFSGRPPEIKLCGFQIEQKHCFDTVVVETVSEILRVVPVGPRIPIKTLKRGRK